MEEYLDSLPYLNFFPYTTHRSVVNFLLRRKNQISLNSVYLSCVYYITDWVLVVDIILSYAFGHNVQQLTIDHTFPLIPRTFPVRFFSSISLKQLTLRGIKLGQMVMSASTWELLALTTLHLDNVEFFNESNDMCIDLFSKCVNLKNLILEECNMMASKSFRICHPHLSNLTIIDSTGDVFRSNKPLQFSIETMHSLEKLDLCIEHPCRVDASKIFALLQHLHGIKFLTLNFKLAQVYLICICP